MRTEKPDEEIKRLQSCINDLVVVLALPAIWTSHEPSRIANTLLDVLVRLLQLDFAFVRLNDSVDGPPIEFARTTGHRDIRLRDLHRVLDRWLTADALEPNLVVSNPVDDGVVSIAAFRLGLQDEVGRLIVGSRRSDFPTDIEQLLLQVAANQAAIGLQEAGHTRQQRRASEVKLSEMRTQLAHAGRTIILGTLAASLAHELNQPLAAVRTNATVGLRLLARREPNIGEARSALEDIVRDNRRAVDIVQHFRTLLKGRPASREPCDLGATVRGVVELVRSDAATRQIALDCRVVEPMPLVNGDQVQLQQVVLNLLINAFDAVLEPSAGARAVTVRTGGDDAGGVVVSVEDHGPPVSDDRFERMQTPLYTTKPEGLGLGLTICREVLAAHGTELRAERKDGGGMVFSFCLH